jgi:hypothetical protein
MPASRRRPGSAVRATADRLIAFADRRRSPAPSLGALDASGWPEAKRAAAGIVWSRRAVNEAQSVELAERLAEAAARTPLSSPPLRGAIERLAEDERGHVALATAFLERIGVVAPRIERTLERSGGEALSLFLLRCVLTGLAVCETVSAVRFATVRQHTDLAIPRACIEHFLRDEIAHARLGFLLLPLAIEHRASVVGAELAAAEIRAELGATFRHLDLVVGLDAERRGITLAPRAQPRDNPAVVEPALDALALRSAITGTVIPRLAGLGIDAGPIWARRWSDSAQ